MIKLIEIVVVTWAATLALILLTSCADNGSFWFAAYQLEAPRHFHGHPVGDKDHNCPIEVIDTDGDLIPDEDDNCPETYNPDQTDLDDDELGAACDEDDWEPASPTPTPGNEEPTPTPTPGEEEPTPTPVPSASPAPSDGETCELADKIWLCHVPRGNPENKHNICVDEQSADAHVGHGDSLGDCE